MQKFFSVVAVSALLAGAASAQTAGEVMDAEGLEGFSMLEIQVGRALMEVGVPTSCIGEMSMSDIRRIAALANTGEGASDSRTRREIGVIIDNACN